MGQSATHADAPIAAVETKGLIRCKDEIERPFWLEETSSPAKFLMLTNAYTTEITRSIPRNRPRCSWLLLGMLVRYLPSAQSVGAM